VRKLIARLFGFDADLAELQAQRQELQAQIQELQWDRPFGMLTRGAFVQHCRVMPRGVRNIAFIDLDNINVLNDRYGYTAVDERVRTTFSVPFRRSDIVARWYSGDEIVILFDSDRQGAERKIAELRRAAAENDLTFQVELGQWAVGNDTIEEGVAAISQNMAGAKRRQKRRMGRPRPPKV
jgi:diguanylate cyclase (GGDEF)-like protein